MTAPVCGHPDCTRRIGRDNRSDVCRAHQHSRWCRCVQCLAHGHPQTAAAPPLDRMVRPGTHSVAVATHSTHSGIDSHARITLPCPPWEASE